MFDTEKRGSFCDKEKEERSENEQAVTKKKTASERAGKTKKKTKGRSREQARER